MWALIAFIALGIIVATLIEVNERIKAKKKPSDPPAQQSDTASCEEACSSCELLSVCDKETKKKKRATR